MLYRLWYFPTRVIRSTFIEAIEEQERQGAIFPFAAQFRILLCALLVRFPAGLQRPCALELGLYRTYVLASPFKTHQFAVLLLTSDF
jgi:hypothetical protein